jgi:hypothetical protein
LRAALRAIYVVERMSDSAGNIEMFARQPITPPGRPEVA